MDDFYGLDDALLRAKLAYDDGNFLNAIPLLSDFADSVPDACLYLGNIYKWGSEDIEVDRKQSLMWSSRYIFLLNRLAKSNVLDAQFELARCFQYGDCVSCDEARAIELYEDCANRGYSKAQFHLSCLLQFGWCGLKVDADKRIYWLQKAAEAEFPEALYDLGLVHLQFQDKDQGLKLIERSATLGFWPADEFLKRN